ncbi:MAG: ATP-binding protein [Chitinophagales bacterium]
MISYSKHCRFLPFKVLILLLFAACTNSKSPGDKVNASASESKEDSTLLKRLRAINQSLIYERPDSAIKLGDSIIRAANELGFSNVVAKAEGPMGDAYFQKGDLVNALICYRQQMSLNEQMKDSGRIANAYGNFANVYAELGDYRKAIDYQLKCNSIEERQSISAQRRGRNVVLAYNTADIYRKCGILDSALYFAKNAIDAQLARMGTISWSALPRMLGDVYLTRKEYENAIAAYNIITTDNWSNDSVDIYIGKSSAFLHLGQVDSCIFFAHQALDISERIPYPKGILGSEIILGKAYENINQAEALKYLKLSIDGKEKLYGATTINTLKNMEFNEERRKLDVATAEKAAIDKLKFQGMWVILFILLIVGTLLWRNNRQKQKSNIKLEKAYEELKSTQTQLIQSEKMASLGELTAGIAHEIQNPLNFVNNFSEVNAELLNEMKKEIDKGNFSEVKLIADNIIDNEEKIGHHGKRADSIVKGMLQHSRTSTGLKEPTDINALTDEYLRLAYHGFRAKEHGFNVSMKTVFDPTIGQIDVVPQDIGRVLLNLFNNAFYALSAKALATADGSYQPTLSVTTKKLTDKIEIIVRDNGNGIPEKNLDKIFQPFFTTKQTGQGTGLGLSISYDIIKAHGGEINVETKEGEYAKFSINIPVMLI